MHTCLHTYINLDAHTLASRHQLTFFYFINMVSPWMWIDVCVYIHMCIYVHTYRHTHICIHIYIYIYIYRCISMTQSIVAMCHDAHALTTYIYTHIHPHTHHDVHALISRHQLAYIIYAHIYTYTYIHIHAMMRVPSPVDTSWSLTLKTVFYMCICINLYTYVYINIYVYIYCKCIYTKGVEAHQLCTFCQYKNLLRDRDTTEIPCLHDFGSHKKGHWKPQVAGKCMSMCMSAQETCIFTKETYISANEPPKSQDH